MPQPVMIQTEPMASVSARKNAGAGGSTDKAAFSAELNQQLEQGQAASSSARSDKPQAAKPAETEQNVAADGNKLPAEENSKAVSDSETDAQAQTESDAQQQASEAESQSSHDESTAEQQNTDGTSPATEEQEAGVVVAAGQTADTTKAAETKAKDSAGEQADKPVRAQVTVSQQAVDNAKTSSVEMTAKTHPQQNDAVKTEVTASEKNSQQTAAKTISDTIDKLTAEEKQQAQKSTPNLAAALKQLSEDKAEPAKIRADIMDALQRQQNNKQEVTTNLRNLMAAQAQQAETKPAVTLPPVFADRADSTSPLVPTTLSGLTTSHSTTGATTVTQPGLSLPVQPNMQNPAWAQVMSSRVVYMAKEGVQQAELRMNPANLGPVEVRLHVQNDQASVTFLAQQGATREALEQALPRLRESFAESGLQLANAEVGEHQHQHQEQSEQASDSHIFAQASRQDDDIENETVESVSSEEVAVGLSLYA